MVGPLLEGPRRDGAHKRLTWTFAAHTHTGPRARGWTNEFARLIYASYF